MEADAHGELFAKRRGVSGGRSIGECFTRECGRSTRGAPEDTPLPEEDMVEPLAVLEEDEMEGCSLLHQLRAKPLNCAVSAVGADDVIVMRNYAAESGSVASTRRSELVFNNDFSLAANKVEYPTRGCRQQWFRSRFRRRSWFEMVRQLRQCRLSPFTRCMPTWTSSILICILLPTRSSSDTRVSTRKG